MLTQVSMTENVGSRLRWLRHVAGVSQRDADRIAGRAVGHVGMIETRGNSELSARVARDLAAAFGTTVDWLLDGIGDPPTAEQVRAAVERARADQAARVAIHDATPAPTLDAAAAGAA